MARLGVEELRGRDRGRPLPSTAVRLVRSYRGAQRQPAKTRLEPRSFRGGENRRLPDVFPQPQMAVERRDR